MAIRRYDDIKKPEMCATTLSIHFYTERVRTWDKVGLGTRPDFSFVLKRNDEDETSER